MIQNKKKVRFNLLDALIVMVILGLISAVVYGLFGGLRDAGSQGDTAITFDVKISNVKEAALSLIAEGLPIKNSVTGETIGTVAAVRKEKSRYYGGAYADENGIYTLNTAEYPDEYDVYVTVSASAEADDRGIFYVDDIRMLIGEPVYFQVKSFSAVSYIVNTAASNETEQAREEK